LYDNIHLKIKILLVIAIRLSYRQRRETNQRHSNLNPPLDRRRPAVGPGKTAKWQNHHSDYLGMHCSSIVGEISGTDSLQPHPHMIKKNIQKHNKTQSNQKNTITRTQTKPLSIKGKTH